MSKYSPDAIREMAQEWVVDHTAGGERSFQVAITLSIVTGLGIDEVVDRICALAQGVDVYA